MDDARILTSEQLMAEMGWVRQLARALVKNDALADDIAQDTWLIAERQHPETDRPLRPWLARVVTNLARTRRTSEARRDRRDIAYDDGRNQATPAELVERVELQRALADEVLALAEPYRSTVLLHFFEGCSSAEIARRLGIPDGTVRRRLKVALDQLREALRKRNDPPKGGWLAALIPFAQLPSPSPGTTAMGALAMKKVIGVIGALVLLMIVGGVIWHQHTSSHDDGAGSNAQGAGAAHALAGTDEVSNGATIPSWVVKAGAPPRRIAGRVVFHGAPAAGAKVSLGLEVTGEPSPTTLMPSALPQVVQPLAERTTGADGRFDFGVQPAAVFMVSAGATDRASAVLPVDNANPRTPSDQLELKLEGCTHRMFGTISDASGGPIAKARVSAAGLSGTESDATGHYSLCVRSLETFGSPIAKLRVEADGYGTLARIVIVVGNLHTDFALVPEAVLVGRVTTTDGHPVAGARVTANMEPFEIPHDLASRWADADLEGKFRITGLAPGAFQLMAEARGMHSTPVPIIARPAKSSAEIHLVLEQKQVARVRGHVFRKGAPVSGAVVLAFQSGGPGGSCISQADGSFVLDSVPYGATKLVAPPTQPDPANEIQVAKPEIDGVRIDIDHVATVSGHVTRHGKPVEGANLFYILAPQATIFGGPPTATTDASGAYSLVLPPGPGQLQVWDMASKSFAIQKPLTIKGDDDQTLDFSLDHAGEVQGTVVDQSGVPVAGAYVRLEHPEDGDQCEAVADDHGRFDCASLEGGSYRVAVTPSPGARHGFAPASGDHFDAILVPQDDVVTGIQLAVKNERFSIAGTVVDDTGAALADVRVEAATGGDATMGFPSTISDTTGHFEIANLGSGAYDLDARAADGGDGELRGVAAGTTAVSIKIMRPGAIEGTLTGFTSTPEVFIVSPTGGARGGRAIVDGNTFSRFALPAGKYDVNAMAGAEADGQTLDIAPGETKHVDLRNRGTGTIEGTVTELGTHAPVPNMRCDAHLALGNEMSIVPPDPAHQAFTDAAGHFTVSAPLGRARLFCFEPNGGLFSPAGGDVDVTAAGRVTASVASVRATFGGAPGDAGFILAPGTLPVTVGGVLPNGPAATAGLRPGDQVVSIDGVALQGLLPQGAMTLIMNHRPGTTVLVGLQRGGATQTVKIVVRGPPG